MMDKFEWTGEQELAIRAGEGDVLLTAGAGSGKTAVLAERCVYLLTEAEQRCNIDELLVLTFTEAAAAQMRARIGEQLQKRARSDKRLREQLVLLDKAHIGTVHSFCLAVLKEFFYQLSLDGTFEILDADDADLLKLQIGEDLFEGRFAQAEGDSEKTEKLFPQFVQSYGAGGGDQSLVHLLIRLHNFLDTLGDQEKWLECWRGDLEAAGKVGPENLKLVGRQREILQGQLGRMIERLKHAQGMIEHYPELNFYAGYIQDKLLPGFEEISKELGAGNFAEALERLEELSKLERAPSRPKDMGEEDIAPIKNLIDEAKEEYKKLRGKYAVGAAAVARHLEATGGFVDLLNKLREEFALRYEKVKRQQNVLDFTDLERLCLGLLWEKYGPTEVARQLQRRFKYILVDEYQDISPLQEAIIQCLRREADEEGKGNLFLVGDVKQSIYGFRSAEPDIFLEKFKNFVPIKPGHKGKAGLGPKRIDLNKNFRARRGLIDGINYIFSRCITREFGEIDYHTEARLVYGATCYQKEESAGGAAVEWHFIERDLDGVITGNGGADQASTEGDWEESSEEFDATRREALIVGRRIREMVGLDIPEGLSIVDPETGQERRAEFRDIVVLLRSMKMRAEAWSEVFTQMGIPVHADLSQGYFVATEIQDMVCLLQLLDNPQQDIPLAAVLRGPIGRLDESELTAIRINDPKGSFYQAVKNYIKEGDEAELRDKLAGFLQRLEEWRGRGRKGSLAELIGQIYRETDFPAYVSGLPEGRQRYRNLIYLHDCARRFDSFAQQGLGRFLRFIEKLREEEGDFGPAPVLTEADNVVRIMSIHKSKGLEFPVVIAADLDRRFNFRDCKGSILFTNPQAGAGSYGVGLRVVDSMTQDRWATVAHSVSADDLQQRQLAEEMRILYVAFTRARERLVLVASTDIEKRRGEWESWRYYRKRLPEFLLRGARSALDWLGPAVACHTDMQDFFGEGKENKEGITEDATGRFAVRSYSGEEVKGYLAEIDTSAERSRKPKTVEEVVRAAGGDKTAGLSQEVREVVERLEWRYRHEGLQKMRARASVTDLKHIIEMEQDPEFVLDYWRGDMEVTAANGGSQASKQNKAERGVGAFRQRPKFMAEQEQRPTAAETGSWVHLFLEKLELNGTLEEADLQNQLERIIEKGFLSEQQGRSIDLKWVEKLFQSELGKKIIANREKMEREWPFTLSVPAGEIYRGAEVSEQDKNEPVLVRGVIDCLLEAEGGMVIIDYKTDQVSREQCKERAEEYKVQMYLYRRAVEVITGRAVKEMYIYFLRPGKDIRMR